MARTEPDGRAGPGGPSGDAVTAGGADTPAVTASRLSVLRIASYRWFFLGQFTSAFGDYVVGPALAFAVLDLTGSVGDIGLVLAARTVPIVLFMLVGGVLADRLPRHLVMIGADAARAVTQAVTAALVLSGHAEIWQLMALQAVHGTASALFTPAVSGLIQQTVPSAQLQAANALRGMAQSAAMIAGPPAATLLVVTVGPGWAVGADALTFVVSAVCLSRLRLSRTERAGGPAARDLVGDLRAGWREFTSRTWVWSLISAASLTNACYAVFMVLGPALSERELGGPGAWGAILTAFGAGAVSGGAITLTLRPRRPLRFAVLAVSLFATPALVMSQSSSAVPVAVAAFLGGIGLMVFNPLWETVLQQEVPSTALSKVSAYEWLGSYAAQPFGMTLAGPAAAVLGIRRTLLAVGLSHLAIALAPLAARDVREHQVPRAVPTERKD
ncbi:MFS transporter [Streptomyces sp. NBC_01236]|uniref:MFS transporter n=1 Tax=Streptomyces sp. NBC_01236 TaxID=2903789 RepID=UPI002E100C94|nr:MFS transporter [Streptomyces sp. NBC_01236]